MKFADVLLDLLRKRGSAWEDDGDLDRQIDADMRDVATKSGIADVDPEPLSHIAGEGIDLDRDVNAQKDIKEQREKLRAIPSERGR
ncbi:MAG TPA: hypothetical protein VL326_20325 [Kofleriaceae bacterium]|jgi:hypothetical protein|nr:hypothetical protein [Kofleriaceae bacterium]